MRFKIQAKITYSSFNNGTALDKEERTINNLKLIVEDKIGYSFKLLETKEQTNYTLELVIEITTGAYQLLENFENANGQIFSRTVQLRALGIFSFLLHYNANEDRFEKNYPNSPYQNVVITKLALNFGNNSDSKPLNYFNPFYNTDYSGIQMTREYHETLDYYYDFAAPIGFKFPKGFIIKNSLNGSLIVYTAYLKIHNQSKLSTFDPNNSELKENSKDNIEFYLTMYFDKIELEDEKERNALNDTLNGFYILLLITTVKLCFGNHFVELYFYPDFSDPNSKSIKMTFGVKIHEVDNGLEHTKIKDAIKSFIDSLFFINMFFPPSSRECINNVKIINNMPFDSKLKNIDLNILEKHSTMLLSIRHHQTKPAMNSNSLTNESFYEDYSIKNYPLEEVSTNTSYFPLPKEARLVISCKSAFRKTYSTLFNDEKIDYKQIYDSLPEIIKEKIYFCFIYDNLPISQKSPFGMPNFFPNIPSNSNTQNSSSTSGTPLSKTEMSPNESLNLNKPSSSTEKKSDFKLGFLSKDGKNIFIENLNSFYQAQWKIDDKNTPHRAFLSFEDKEQRDIELKKIKDTLNQQGLESKLIIANSNKSKSNHFIVISNLPEFIQTIQLPALLNKIKLNQYIK